MGLSELSKVGFLFLKYKKETQLAGALSQTKHFPHTVAHIAGHWSRMLKHLNSKGSSTASRSELRSVDAISGPKTSYTHFSLAKKYDKTWEKTTHLLLLTDYISAKELASVSC